MFSSSDFELDVLFHNHEFAIEAVRNILNDLGPVIPPEAHVVIATMLYDRVFHAIENAQVGLDLVIKPRLVEPSLN